MVRTVIALLAVPGGVLVGQPPVANPNGEAQNPRGGVAEGLELDREAFTYVVAGRRDPFLPTSPHLEAGPRFQEARVLGIISHRDPRMSVAVISVVVGRAADAAGQSVSGPGSGGDRNYRLRVGDRVGGMRVRSIHERHVVVEVAGSDSPTLRILELPHHLPIGQS